MDEGATVSTGEPASPAVFFFRLILGGVTGNAAPDTAWTTLSSSAIPSEATPAFLRVRVFLIGGGWSDLTFRHVRANRGLHLLS